MRVYRVEHKRTRLGPWRYKKSLEIMGRFFRKYQRPIATHLLIDVQNSD